MKILVTGVGGQLGHDVCLELDRRGLENKGVDVADFDITDKDEVFRALTEYKPDAVIHCAAYTAVDKAEDDAEKCERINVEGSRNIAEACKECGAKMMYISTDYVFPGVGSYFYGTDDEVGPNNVYGATKLAGEKAVRETLDRFFIVRTSWVYGINGGNFVKTMLRLAETRTTLSVVDDQIGSPTFTEDLAVLLCDMIVTEEYGVYHGTNEDICSWADFAEEIFRIAGKTMTINRVTTEQYGARAARPKNSRLSKRKLTEHGFNRLPTWQDALDRYIKELTAE